VDSGGFESVANPPEATRGQKGGRLRQQQGERDITTVAASNIPCQQQQQQQQRNSAIFEPMLHNNQTANDFTDPNLPFKSSIESLVLDSEI
jgi:hypothetical protein